jgi:hypothetical protein
MFHGFGSDIPSSSARRTHPGRQTCVTQKGPSQRGGGACASLHGKVCIGAPDRPPGAAYHSQIAGGSARAPGRTVHFKELLAIFFCRQGRHHHPGAGPAWLRRMPEHNRGGGDHGDLWGDNIFGPYTKKKGVSPMARLEDGRLAHSAHGSSSIHLAPCFFKQSKVCVLRPVRISTLALSTCPLLFG